MSDDRFAAGLETRRSVLGDAHVDRAEAAKTAFDADFQRFITEGAWGSVRSRPGLDKRTRSLLVVALLAALGHEEELAPHVRATRNTGATPEDIAEVLLMVAVYAGVPAANTAIRIAKAIYADRGSAANGGGEHGMNRDGEYRARNREIHPPAYFPDYKTSVARSPRLPLIACAAIPVRDHRPGARPGRSCSPSTTTCS